MHAYKHVCMYKVLIRTTYSTNRSDSQEASLLLRSITVISLGYEINSDSPSFNSTRRIYVTINIAYAKSYDHDNVVI